MSKEDMIKEAVEEAKAEAAKMEDEAAADEQDEAAETKGSVEEEASKETEESQDTKDTESDFLFYLISYPNQQILHRKILRVYCS